MSASTCNCLTEMNALLKDHNTRISDMFVLRGKTGTTGQTMVAVPLIGTERLANLRNGKKPLTVVPHFCPFCGVEYPAYADDARDAPASSADDLAIKVI